MPEDTFTDTMTVFGFAYPDDETSAAAYDRARAELDRLKHCSVWRSALPDRSKWFIFVVDQTGELREAVDWQGEPWPLEEGTVRMLIERRLALALESMSEGKPELDQRAHYGEGGARMYRGGIVDPGSTAA